MEIKLSEAVQQKQLKNIEELYLSAFPKEERKPFSLIQKKKDEGYLEILSVENDNGNFIGLVITILYNDLVLLDYFAISPQYRCKGLGSQIIKKLLKKYDGKKFLLEIESTAVSSPDYEQRLRRKNFYLKNGMTPMEYSVLLFGVEMEIMTYNCHVEFNEYHEIFKKVFGADIAEKVSICNKNY